MQKRNPAIATESPDIERNEAHGRTYGAEVGPLSHPTGLCALSILEESLNPKIQPLKKSVIPLGGKTDQCQ